MPDVRRVCPACGCVDGHARLCPRRLAAMGPLERAREELDSYSGSLIGVPGAGEIGSLRRALAAVVEHLEARDA